MKDRLEMYEKVINELCETEMMRVKAEIDRAKKEAIGFSLFLLTAVAVIVSLIY